MHNTAHKNMKEETFVNPMPSKDEFPNVLSERFMPYTTHKSMKTKLSLTNVH